MANSDILIRQIIFDLEIPSQVNFQEYSDAVSKIVKERITIILQDLAMKFKLDSIIFIDNLTVDLGDIDLDNWQAYEGILFDQLLDQLRIQRSSPLSLKELDRGSQPFISLMKFISEFGLLPWSFNTRQKVNFYFKSEIIKLRSEKLIFNIFIGSEKSYSRIINILDKKNILIFLKSLLKQNYPIYKRLKELNKSFHKRQGLALTSKSIKKHDYQILRLFYKTPKSVNFIIKQSVQYFKKELDLNSNELYKINQLSNEFDSSIKHISEQSSISWSKFNEKHFKQFVGLLVTLEENNLLNKVIGSNKVNTSIFLKKIFVKGDFFKTLNNLIQLYKKEQSLSEKKFILTLVDYLFQNKTSNKFEQYLTIILGEIIFKEKKYVSLRRHNLFEDILSLDKLPNDQSSVLWLRFNEIQFKQFIRLMVKIEEKNLFIKPIWSDKVNTSSSLKKIFVKGDFFKTLNNLIQLYKKEQSLSEKKFILTLVDYLFQNKTSNKFEQYLTIILGEIIFKEKKYVSLRRHNLFENILSAIKIRPIESYLEVVEVIKVLLSKDSSSFDDDTIKGITLKALHPSLEKTKPKELFISVLKTLDKNITLPESIQLDSLSDKKILMVFDQVRKMRKSYRKLPNLDSNYFDFILNLDNEMNRLDVSTIRKTNFISLKEILINTKSLISFLVSYKTRDEVLNNFSKITLKDSKNKRFIALLKSDFQSWFEIEKKLIDIQDKKHFSELDTIQFESVLRYFLIKSLASEISSKNILIGEFTFNFLNFIQSRSSIYLNKLKETLIDGSINSQIEEVSIGFSAFVDNAFIDSLPQKTKTDLFYKNIYYSYLETNVMPEWSDQVSIDDFEIVNFIKILVDKKEIVFLERLFIEEKILKNILEYLKTESKTYLKNLIKVIQKDKKNEFVTNLFINLTKLQLKQLSPFLLFEIIILNKLWLIKNPLYLWDRIKEILISIKPEWGDLFESKIKSIFIQKDSEFSNLEKKWIRGDYQFLMRYFIDSTLLPTIQDVSKKEMIQKFSLFLVDNSLLAIGYLVELNIIRIKNTPSFRRLFTKELILKIIYTHFSDSSVFLKEIQMYFKELDRLIKEDELFYKSINLILSNFIVENRNKQNIIPELINIVEQSTDKNSTQLIGQLKHFFSETQNRSIEQSQLQVQIRRDVMRLDTFSYYIELGFYPPEIRDSIKKGFFKSLAKENPLLLKKRLFRWSKDDKKLNRLFKLVESKKDRFLLISIIHPQLLLFLKDLPHFIKSIFSEIGPSYNEKPESENTLLLLLSSWSKANFNLNPYELIVPLIEEFLRLNNKTIEFFKLKLNTPNLKIKSTIDFTQMISLFEQKNKTKKIDKIEILDGSEIYKNELQEGISIKNSGLVIAWPFLNILFSKMGLLENGTFKSDEAKQKAIIATQYLVDGKNKIDETELFLNKILCGADIDFFVDNSLQLNEIEIGICDTALKTIIFQWGKVKSINTLRDYFFKREGVLKLDQNINADLYVEKETRDILIKFLPWNLSVIKTSLMNKKLTIHWKYN